MYILNIFIYGFCGHLFLNKYCNKEYNNFIINLSYKIILYYTHCEKGVKNILRKMNDNPNMVYIKNLLISKNKKGEIEIFKYNERMISTCIYNLRYHLVISYDFIIFTDYHSDGYKVNKVIYYDYPINYDYKTCNFSFISFVVKINKNGKEKCYPIKLLNDEENYYVVGNKINRLIISYLLKDKYNVHINENKDGYFIDIIDQNVDLKLLTENDEIIFNEDSYEVIKYTRIESYVPVSIPEELKKSISKNISENIAFTPSDDIVLVD